MLIHLDNIVSNPVYLTGENLSGTTYGNTITSSDYVDVSSDLPFDKSNNNEAPFIYPVSGMSGGEGQLLEFTLYAYDETQSSLSWTANSSLPTGATFEQSGNNGNFSWTPTIQQSGDYSLSFQVSDGQSVSRVFFGSRQNRPLENRK